MTIEEDFLKDITNFKRSEYGVGTPGQVFNFPEKPKDTNPLSGILDNIKSPSKLNLWPTNPPPAATPELTVPTPTPIQKDNKTQQDNIPIALPKEPKLPMEMEPPSLKLVSQTAQSTIYRDEDSILNQLTDINERKRRTAEQIAELSGAKTGEITPTLPEHIKPIAQNIKDLFTKSALNQLQVEDLLNPNSEKYKEYQNRVDAAYNTYQTAKQDLIDFQKTAKVDPDRYVKNTSGLQDFLYVLGTVVQSVATYHAMKAGLPPPKNYILDNLEKAINQDIQLQKQELAGKETALTNTVNLYKENLKSLGDEKAAELQTALMLGNLYKDRISVLQKSIDNEIGKKQIEDIKNTLDENLLKTQMELNKTIVQNNLQLPIADTKEMKKEQQELEKRKVNVFGYDILARTEDDAKKLKEYQVGAESMLSNLTELEKITKGRSLATLAKLPTEEQKRATVIIKGMMQTYRQAMGMGALDKGVIDFFDGFVPSPNNWLHASAMYDQLKDSIYKDYTIKLNTHTNSKFTKAGVKRFVNNYLSSLIDEEER